MNADAVAIQTHASPEVGYGHLMRCLAIAEALARRPNVSVRWLMSPDADIGPILAAGFPVEPAALGPRSEEVLLLDDPRVGQREAAVLLETAAAVAAFDDLGRLDACPFDVLIDYTRVTRRAAARRLRLGPDYFPVRAPMRAAAERSRKDVKAGAAVIFGGGDWGGFTAPTAARLAAAFPGLPITAIYGLGAAPPSWIASGVEILHAPADLADRLAGAAAVVSAAGATTFELAYLGAPAVLAPLSDDQQAMALQAVAAGAALICPGAPAPPDAVVEPMRRLLNDSALRCAMSAAGRRLIDGRGAERIADAISAPRHAAERLMPVRQ